MLCGNCGGNPLTVAAGKSVITFKATFRVLQVGLFAVIMKLHMRMTASA